MFNVLKTDRDSDFLSLYLEPSIYFGHGPPPEIYLRPGVASEHRFGNKRRFGLYAKAGLWIFVGGIFASETESGIPEGIVINFRFGFQTLLGKHISIALEPYLIEFPGAKVALTWAF